jgi:cyclic pyranopterin phosphate synthase
VDVKIRLDENIPGYQIEAEVKTKAETGVEMEAMTAAMITALTIYDMAKSVEKTMAISNVRLVHKSGGKSGEFNAPKGDYCDLF